MILEIVLVVVSILIGIEIGINMGIRRLRNAIDAVELLEKKKKG